MILQRLRAARRPEARRINIVFYDYRQSVQGQALPRPESPVKDLRLRFDDVALERNERVH
jgi:hypothetical protein